MMKQEKAKELLRIEYLEWKKMQTKIHEDSKFIFCLYIEKNKPELLKFRYSGSDQYKTIYRMIRDL